MQNFSLYNPVRILFGPGEFQRIGAEASKHGKKAMVVSYTSHGVFIDMMKHVEDSLAQNGVEAVTFYRIQANPVISHVREAIEICRKEGVDLVIGLGGGSVMDSAKVIAAGALYPDDAWNMFVTRQDQNTAVPPTASLPTIMIPTLPATSSEMNCVAVVTNDETRQKAHVSAGVLYPTVSIVDPELTKSLSAFHTASGAVDAISHVMEAYLNGDQHSPIHDRIQEGLIRGIMDELTKILADPQNLAYRTNLQWATTLAWNGWLQAGLSVKTSMHKMGHVISALYNVTHGVTLAIFMAATFRYAANLNADRAARFATLGENVMGISREGRADEAVANEFIDRFVAFMKGCGVPTTLSEVGVPESDFEMILEEIIKTGGDANGNLPGFPPIGRDGVWEILRLAK